MAKSTHLGSKVLAAAGLLGITAVSALAWGDAAESQKKSSKKVDLVVDIHALRNNEGRVAVALFDNAEAFPEQERALSGKVASIRDNKTQLVFKGLTPGVYAVAVLHDENRNDKMDFNLLGMPKEGYGFSRDAAVVLGPPDFEDAAVTLRAARSKIRIKTRYFSL